MYVESSVVKLLAESTLFSSFMLHFFLSSDALLTHFLCLRHFIFVGIAGRLDAVFLIDGSQNIDMQTFAKIKDFLKGLISSYKISNKKTRIGLLTFGEKPRKILALEAGSTRSAVQQAIIDLRPIGGERQLAAALRYVRSNIFNKATPSDRDKVILLMTASSVSQGGSENDIKDSLDDFARRKIQFVVIAVDSKRGDKELDTIGKSNPVFYFKNADQLRGAFTKVLDESGKAAGNLNCVQEIDY